MSDLITHAACSIERVVIDPLLGAVAVAKQLDAALKRAHVLHIVGGDASKNAMEFWTAVSETLGNIDLRGENPVTLQRIPAIWNDIRYDPALAAAYRHSKTAQPLHTDGAYNANPPPIGLFFCEAQATSGGRTLFLDAHILEEELERYNPDLRDKLRTVPVLFVKGESPGQIITIISGETDNPVLNWNYHRLAPGQGAEIESLRDAFASFLTTYFPEHRLAPLHLMPGDCMMFHDLHVLHGREAFEAKAAGDRCLWNLNLHWRPMAEEVQFF